MVRDQHPEAGAEQAYEFSVHEGPGRISVQHHDGVAGTLIKVMQLLAVDVEKVGTEIVKMANPVQ